MKSVCTNAKHCTRVCTALSEKAKGNSKITRATSSLVMDSLCFCISRSCAHACSPSISFIIVPWFMNVKPFLCIWLLLCYLGIISHHTRAHVRNTQTLCRSLEQWCCSVEGAAMLDKSTDLIPSLRHTSPTELQCNYSPHFMMTVSY